MATAQMYTVLQHVHRSLLLREAGGRTDGHLLEAFVARREEAAFAALVERHGPMVLGVCRRVISHAQDAEDAFQATFLVLARKAAAVVPRESVGNWLYGVAYRTALEARARAHRQRAKEKQVMHMPDSTVTPEVDGHELQSLLDRELSRLPDKYRLPIVLCELECRSRKEVAQQLKLAEGTLSSRLATARKKLAQRLARHGVGLAAGAAALNLSQCAASTCVPTPLLMATVKAAACSAASDAAAAGLVSAQVAALTEGVIRAMFMTKLKVAGVALFGLGLMCLGAGMVASQAAGVVPDDAAPVRVGEPVLVLAQQQVNGQQVNGQQVNGQQGNGQQGNGQQGNGQQGNQQNGQKDKKNDKNKDDKNKDDGQNNQNDDGQKNNNDDGDKNQNDDGQKNNNNDGDKNNVDNGQVSQAFLKAVVPAKNTITVRRAGQKADETLDLAKPLAVVVGGKAATVADLKPGMYVNLSLSKDKKAVVRISQINVKNGNANQPQ